MSSRIMYLLVVALVALVAVAQDSPRTDRERLYLVGDVKAVHAVDLSYPPGVKEGSPTFSSEQLFDPGGWVLEDSTFDAKGKPVTKIAIRRDGPHVIERESIEYDGSRAGRTVASFDPAGRVTEVVRSTLDGQVQERTAIRALPDGTHRTTYDATGKITADVLQQVTPTADGLRSQTTTDGVVTGNTTVHRTPEGSLSTSSADTPTGHIEQEIVRSREGIRNVQVRDGQQMASGWDANHRTLTIIHTTREGIETRSVQHFDAQHRLVSAESYRDGILRDLDVVTYENDERGNWIKKTTKHCSDADHCGEPVLATTRTITYY